MMVSPPEAFAKTNLTAREQSLALEQEYGNVSVSESAPAVEAPAPKAAAGFKAPVKAAPAAKAVAAAPKPTATTPDALAKASERTARREAQLKLIAEVCDCTGVRLCMRCLG